ncbi:mannose-1-phosphate guanylyltransferase [Flavobacterium agrisoli]|uniref:Mannose-1-phosphate guanylyltransferase n=1 Tax=Flavobacterium agrisoli TaxID=2793066 RepID=A0A934PRD4_9FLAO|nr:mannose-1-phosphate guanylyltransferase [Flavobacterium agrisoli]MBK0371278.1 mannose-1-phosphate guanylyltransferase [Flavobacterium agrisoli]
MDTIVHVILTGGVGSRLWPLSRKSQPKQYLGLFEGQSLFEKTVVRNQDMADSVIVVGSVDNSHLSQATMEKLGVSYTNIVEATPRNTAAAIAFAALASAPEAVLVVTPSDHIIEGEAAYELALKDAVAKAQHGAIVTFGVVPTKPETGYGYIEADGDRVVSFREKPNEVTAKDFISRGAFLWNSGMFCFKAGVFLEELQKYQPEVFEKSKIVWENNQNGQLDFALSKEIPSISVDYAVMERSKKIKVVPAAFQWSDLGSFESVYDYLVAKGHEVDANGNMVIGCDTYTSFLGLQNTIFVHTPTANLILQKERSQDVKDIYNALEKVQSKLLE